MLSALNQAPLKFKVFLTTLAVWTVVLLILASCTPETEEKKVERAFENGGKSTLIAIIEGCKIYEVYNNQGTNPFFALCPNGPAPAFSQRISGKNVTTRQFMVPGAK